MVKFYKMGKFKTLKLRGRREIFPVRMTPGFKKKHGISAKPRMGDILAVRRVGRRGGVERYSRKGTGVRSKSGI